MKDGTMKRKKRRSTTRTVIATVFIIGLVVLLVNGLDIFSQEENEPGEQDHVADTPNQPPKEPVEEVPEDPRTETLRITAVGDVIYHMSQIESAYDAQSNTYDFKPFFELIKPIIQEADIAIANYEGTTAGLEVEPYMAYPRFNAPDETLDALKYAGFNVISTINNHSLDMRKYGLIRTLEQLHKRGFKTVGTYEERPDTRVLYVEEKDIKLAFLAYTYGLNGMEVTLTTEELDYMVNLIDKTKILEDIEDAKSESADMIIAIMHWGNEYQRNPSNEQKELAEYMFSNGVDIILGSHPHVIQDAKTKTLDGDTKFVIYSMGNFISNQRQESLDHEYPNLDNFYTEDGVIVQIEIEKDFGSSNTVIKEIEVIPTWVNRYRQAPLYHYDVIPIEFYLEGNPLGLDEHTLSRMQRSYRDTMEKIDIEIN
jgi:poly-gamma-glutamate synthesis protein (capsule biosynthesis protein)